MKYAKRNKCKWHICILHYPGLKILHEPIDRFRKEYGSAWAEIAPSFKKPQQLKSKSGCKWKYKIRFSKEGYLLLILWLKLFEEGFTRWFFFHWASGRSPINIERFWKGHLWIMLLVYAGSNDRALLIPRKDKWL